MSLPLFEALAEIDLDLRQLRVRWALLGGLAVSIRSEPRTTKDIDLAVAVADDREAERIIGDLMARGYQMLHEPLERTDMDRMSTVRLVASARSGRVIVDFLFASCGIEPEIVAAAELREAVPGIELPVITMAHLLAIKSLAGRDKDRADIQSLLRYASEEDLLAAREALDLISSRGFDEGRDLQIEFAEHIARFSQATKRVPYMPPKKQEGRTNDQQEGLERGLRLGKADLLKSLAAQRFGELPGHVLERIDHADVDTLERWGRHLLDAQNLEDVFDDEDSGRAP